MLGLRARGWGVIAGMLAAAGCQGVVVQGSTGGGVTTGTGATGGVAGSETTSTSTSAGGTGGSAGSSTGGTGPAGCLTNEDCAGNPDGLICNPETGKCGWCVHMDDPAADCGLGQWCDEEISFCVTGCTGDADCYVGDELTCDLPAHTCVECLDDSQCAPGTVCEGKVCVPGCDQDHACQAGWSCCFGVCYNLSVDPAHCGSCNSACDPYPNAQPTTCDNEMCQPPHCLPGFADCNLVPYDGCEHNVLADGPCACAPGSVESCYLGAPGTEGVGPCHAGQRVCDAQGEGWGPCQG